MWTVYKALLPEDMVEGLSGRCSASVAVRGVQSVPCTRVLTTSIGKVDPQPITPEIPPAMRRTHHGGAGMGVEAE